MSVQNESYIQCGRCHQQTHLGVTHVCLPPAATTAERPEDYAPRRHLKLLPGGKEA